MKSYQSQNGVRVLKYVAPDENNAIIRPEMPDRDFWMTMRHSLLQQLAAIEKRLGISRRCRHCGNDLSTKTG